MPELNLLVRMPNWLGDCVMAMPALQHLSDALPHARIHLAGRRAFAGLLAAQPGVDSYIEAPESGIGPLIRSMSDTRRLVREAGMEDGADIGLLFTNSLSTAAWLWRSGAEKRIGYSLDCRRFFLTHPVPCGGVERSWHFIRYYLWLAKFAVSIATETAFIPRRETRPLGEYLLPSLAVGEAGWDEAAEILDRLGVDGAFAVIAPASAYGPVKDWPPEHYRRLVAGINRDFSLPVLVTGGAAQGDACAEIARGQEAAFNLAGKTGLEGFAALLGGAALFVGGDSGGAHVAAAQEVPTVVVFGVTNPSRTRPTGLRVREMGGGEDHDVKLSTRAAREAAREKLAAISPESVLDAARDLMKKADNARP